MSLAGDPRVKEPWYYSLELEPGVWTAGLENPNICLARELLAGVRLEPADRCLDIGTQEALIPVLLGRRGVKEIVAYDRELAREHLALVKETLGVDFELLGGFGMEELRSRLVAAAHSSFDLVVFSGVLYHMVDPFSGLCWARGVTRTGGLVLVESMVTFTDALAIHLDLGRFSPGGITVPSVRGLERMLQAVGLEPIDAVTDVSPNAPDPEARPGAAGDERSRTGRVAAICRAVAPEERRAPLADREFDTFIDRDFLGEREPLAYESAGGRPVLAGEPGELQTTPQHGFVPPDERLRLALEDRY